MKKIIFLLMFGVLFSQTKVEDVKSFTLKNGMKVLVVEDNSIPNATMYLFWKVGSRNEYPGITGLSHFFEHMMFNGAKKYGFKQFDRVMEAAGGANNAYTSENTTVYMEWFPANQLELMMDLEADRIMNLNFDEKVVESERGVIYSEYTTGLENSNYRLLYANVLPTAMVAHPYHWDVIGYESDILNWKKSDLEKYFKTYYAPNNCVVVVCGDVKLDNVKALTEKYFEPIPAQEPPRKIHTVEPKQMGEKRVLVHKDVANANVMLAYHVPATNSPEFYALDLLNSILSDGNSSRLYSNLVDKERLAIQISGSLSESFDPFLYTFYGICNDGVTPEKLEKGIYKVLDEIIKTGVTEEELKKAKNIKAVQFYDNIETISGRADALGKYELFFGDYKKMFTAPDEYNKVTIEDIKNVAKKYFDEDNRTVGILKAKGVKK